jgi:hypothetical protein
MLQGFYPSARFNPLALPGTVSWGHEPIRYLFSMSGRLGGS